MSSISYNRKVRGFGLVEVMVAMVIGMLGILVMMQVFSVAEQQKRTTTGADDAETNGAIAIYGLQRDIRQSGYGITDMSLLGCSLQLRVGITLNSIAAVAINSNNIPAGDANTDTLLILYGNTNGSPQGDGITTQPAANVYAVQTPTAYLPADNVIATPLSRSPTCSLILDQVQIIISPNVTVGTGVAGVSNGKLFNIGSALHLIAYAVRGGNLTSCDYSVNDCGNVANVGNKAIWVSVANNIVSLRVLYGRDTSGTMDGVVDVYDQTTPNSACNWSRVSAIQLALVARNGQFDKTNPTAVAPVWVGSAVAPIDLTANADWHGYRYKLFQTTIPLRNIAWFGVQTGC